MLSHTVSANNPSCGPQNTGRFGTADEYLETPRCTDRRIPENICEELHINPSEKLPALPFIYFFFPVCSSTRMLLPSFVLQKDEQGQKLVLNKPTRGVIERY